MPVYEGVWYNHESHKLVLTLSPAAAGFLSAAIVTWVNLVAAATWPIFKYLLHAIRQTAPIRDVYHHQQQALLRNSASAAGAAGQLLRMAFGWRSYPVRSGRRSFFYIVISIIIFVLWMLCGLYAPYIYTRTGDDVLLKASPNCGFATLDESVIDDVNNIEPLNLFSAESINTMAAADAYVRRCYPSTFGENGNTSASQCITYPRQSLPYTISDGQCPFGDLCVTTNSTPILYDTGLLDSNIDFGINARKEDTVQYRRQTTCSPLNLTGFVSVYNTTGTADADDYPEGTWLIRYWFGPNIVDNFTYEYQPLMALYPIAYTIDSYKWGAAANLTFEEDGAWQPNVTFYPSADADLAIMFLAGNKVMQTAPVYDPVFAANYTYSSEYNGGVMYGASHWVTVMACKEQHQMCLGRSKDNCTPLVPSGSLLNETGRLEGFRPAHVASAGRLNFAITVAGMSDPVTALGSASLLASRTLSGVTQTEHLPQDQWRLEMTNWFSMIMARTQASVLSYAIGPDNPELYKYINHPNEVGIKYACEVQRARDAQGYVNFDLSGLLVLIVFGAGLAVLGLGFETIVGLLSKLRSSWWKRRESWLSEGLYHLQMKALETQGIKEWHDLDSSIPKSRQMMDTASPSAGLSPTIQEEQVQAVSLLYDGKAA